MYFCFLLYFILDPYDIGKKRKKSLPEGMHSLLNEPNRAATNIHDACEDPSDNVSLGNLSSTMNDTGPYTFSVANSSSYYGVVSGPENPSVSSVDGFASAVSSDLAMQTKSFPSATTTMLQHPSYYSPTHMF